MTAGGRFYDNSDESVVLVKLIKDTVLKSIEKIKRISSILLQVAVKDDEDAQSFTFSRIWTPPRTTLRLSADLLSLINVSRLVANVELVIANLVLSLPVLQHLGVDTVSLLEKRRDLLDGTDCSRIESSLAHGGQVSRLIIIRLSLPSISDTA